MPDLDLNDPLRDRAHEALRAATVQAVNDLGDGLSLTDVLFDLIDDLYAQIDAANIRADASEIRANTAYDAIDDLQRRIAALENP